MAYPVVASVGTGDSGTGANVTISKPSGLAVGDVMIAIVGWDPSGTTPALSGWTLIDSIDPGGFLVAIAAYIKIADSADVAASNFTTTGGSAGSARVVGIIYRITGSAITDPIVVAHAVQGQDGSSNPFRITAGLTPGSLECLLIGAAYGSNDPNPMSGYAVVNNNPALWTEDIETSSTEAMTAVHANYAPETATGEFSMVPDASGPYAAILLAIRPLPLLNGTAALLQGAPAIFAPVTTNGAAGSNALLVGTPEIFAPEGSAENPRWTDQERADATWTDEERTL